MNRTPSLLVILLLTLPSSFCSTKVCQRNYNECKSSLTARPIDCSSETSLISFSEAVPSCETRLAGCQRTGSDLTMYQELAREMLTYLISTCDIKMNDDDEGPNTGHLPPPASSDIHYAGDPPRSCYTGDILTSLLTPTNECLWFDQTVGPIVPSNPVPRIKCRPKTKFDLRWCTCNHEALVGPGCYSQP